YDTLIISVPPGEFSKSREKKQYIENEMMIHGCDRSSVILSFGGGVVGDLSGFVASTYMRGVSYIQIPTTFLAMVDSSIGGKTAINTDFGKNLVGSFWYPALTLIDIDFLSTLSQEHLINGLIESLKVFLIRDKLSFEYLLDNKNIVLDKNNVALIKTIAKSINIKNDIVNEDPNEKNLRMILNFGHTIGHAIEKLSNYNILHGLAVALGILVEAKISVLLNVLSNNEYEIIERLMVNLNISIDELKCFDFNEIIELTRLDKKNSNSTVRYILLKEIGDVLVDNNTYAHAVDDSIVKASLFQVCEK
ncbi:3-dehydroquinate synthase, partial [Gammaproteobacteria bacterium]|nr:3-dehydroquinate synthase [Gammaproteobacteria bacterium]